MSTLPDQYGPDGCAQGQPAYATRGPAYEFCRQYAKNDRFDVTAHEPTPGHCVVYDWTCHTLRASGQTWEECARKLREKSAKS